MTAETSSNSRIEDASGTIFETATYKVLAGKIGSDPRRFFVVNKEYSVISGVSNMLHEALQLCKAVTEADTKAYEIVQGNILPDGTGKQGKFAGPPILRN
jgi:hypothetical protein